jgi:gluconate 2-dehydrogenase gamma chain
MIKRRDMLKVVGATGAAMIAAPSALEAVERVTVQQQTPTPHAPKFFTPHEWRTVRVLVDDIIPRDERSGSATDAKVPEFMDFIMTDETLRRKPMTETELRGGLAWLARESERRFGVGYAEAAAAKRHMLLGDIAFPKKAAPELQYGAEFFSKMRDFAASGFFSSAMGYKDLEYKGLVFNPDWRGCPDEAAARLGVSYAEWDAKFGKL